MKDPAGFGADRRRSLRSLDLGEFAGRRASTYPGRQRQRLDIGLALYQPEVVFLDEPSTGLGPRDRASLCDQVCAPRDMGMTISLAAHYLEEADAPCHRLVIMDHGEPVAGGMSRNLKHQVTGESEVLSLRRTGDAVTRLSALTGVRAFACEISVDGDRIARAARAFRRLTGEFSS